MPDNKQCLQIVWAYFTYCVSILGKVESCVCTNYLEYAWSAYSLTTLKMEYVDNAYSLPNMDTICKICQNYLQALLIVWHILHMQINM